MAPENDTVMTELFERANAKGKQAEGRIIQMIRDAGGSASKNTLTHNGHCDILAVVGGRPFRIEVKNEDAYSDSPNLCIEQYQGRKEAGGEVKGSGVTTTEACVMIHTLGTNAAIYLPSQMRNWMRENRRNFPFKTFGDNGNGGTLVPISRVSNLWWFDRVPMASLMTSKIWKL